MKKYSNAGFDCMATELGPEHIKLALNISQELCEATAQLIPELNDEVKELINRMCIAGEKFENEHGGIPYQLHALIAFAAIAAMYKAALAKSVEVGAIDFRSDAQLEEEFAEPQGEAEEEG